MSDIYITDMTHFEGIPSGTSYEPARRITQFFGAIVSAATVSPADKLIDSTLSCRRRPGRRPCPGHLQIRRDNKSGVISWQCNWCNNRGEISNWEGTTWDLSTWAFGRQAGMEFHEIILTEEELRELKRSLILSPGSVCLLYGAVIAHGGIVIRATLEELEELEDEISADANHEEKRSRQKILDRIHERIETLFDQEQYYGSDFEEWMENAQQELSLDTEMFADEWARKMNNDNISSPVYEGMIPSEVVERTWQRIAGCSPKDIRKLVDRMSKDQPVVLAYLMAVDNDIFNQNEREDLLLLGIVVWQIMLQGNKPLPEVTEIMLEKAEDDNLKMIKYFQNEAEAGLVEATRRIIESYKQPEILKYVVEAIMEETDEDIPVRDEYRGLMLLDLKTVIDCFNA